MRERMKRYVLMGLVVGVCGIPAMSSAQSYRQQGIYPVFDGWEDLPDGSKLIYFGYMNRHATEITIPVGADNGFEQAPADRMQPTNFLPGRHEHVFTVRVPKNFTGKLIWDLKTGVGLQKAIASLDQLYILEVEDEPGEKVVPPEIKAADATVKISEALHLAPQVKAEAVKREAVIEGSGARQSGLAVIWNMHRGPGKVTFTAEPGARPVRPAAPAGGRARPEAPPVPGVFSAACALPAAPGCGAVAARFSEPGDYILRAVARQGREQRDVFVHVKVAP